MGSETVREKSGWQGKLSTKGTKLQSATKWVETLRPKLGFFTFYWLQKEERQLFLPHPLHAMLCRCSSHLQKSINTPTLNGGDRGGVRILVFYEVTLFEYNVSKISLPIVAPRTKLYESTDILSSRVSLLTYYSFCCCFRTEKKKPSKKLGKSSKSIITFAKGPYFVSKKFKKSILHRTWMKFSIHFLILSFIR